MPPNVWLYHVARICRYVSDENWYHNKAQARVQSFLLPSDDGRVWGDCEYRMCIRMFIVIQNTTLSFSPPERSFHPRGQHIPTANTGRQNILPTLKTRWNEIPLNLFSFTEKFITSHWHFCRIYALLSAFSTFYLGHQRFMENFLFCFELFLKLENMRIWIAIKQNVFEIWKEVASWASFSWIFIAEKTSELKLNLCFWGSNPRIIDFLLESTFLFYEF